MSRGAGRSGGLRRACGLVVGLLLASVAGAGVLREGPGVVDPGVTLTAPQREAARALGEARRALEAGRLDQAQRALERVGGERSLAGYAALVRVRILLGKGETDAARRLAAEASEASTSEALRAALAVLEGEALARAGDRPAAELAWKQVLGTPGAEDEAVRDSLRLAIVGARQRTGSLDPTIDPRVLLDRAIDDVEVVAEEVPPDVLPAAAVLERANAALSAGRSERAVELFDEALSRDLPDAQRRRAELQRGHALFRSRRYESAARQFTALLPDLEARFWGARSRARAGDVAGSLVEFERVARGKDEDLASWALYLMGTLHEDRGEPEKAIQAYERAARFERFPERVRDALWREGWVHYRRAAWSEARTTFHRLAARIDDPIDALRPRYWAARAAIHADRRDAGREELATIARDFPLTYYGWRARERLSLGEGEGIVTSGELAEGTRRVEDEAIERAALLIEGGLDDYARDELRFAARRATGFEDRTRVGVLLARVGDYHRASRLVVTAYADSLARGVQPGREALWWLSWPPAFRATLDEVFPAGGAIDPELVWAIMREESHYQVDARSPVGALGLLQLMPSTAVALARERGLESFEPTDLFDPEINITLGSAYLVDLAKRFDGRLSAAVASYNAGPSRVASWLRGDAAKLEDDVWVESIPYDQTRAYVKRVLRSLHVYRSFYR